MPKALWFTILGVVAATTGLAQDEIATVTSQEAFRLRGSTITPGEGVPSWPVLAGDTIKAGNALTIITYPDGATVSLEPGAQGNVDTSGGIPSFQLAYGTAVYALKSRRSVRLFSGDKPINPPANTGAYSRNSSRNPPGGGATSGSGGFWTTGHTVIVAGAAAGAATGVALGVGASNSSGSQVSPTH